MYTVISLRAKQVIMSCDRIVSEILNEVLKHKTNT